MGECTWESVRRGKRCSTHLFHLGFALFLQLQLALQHLIALLLRRLGLPPGNVNLIELMLHPSELAICNRLDLHCPVDALFEHLRSRRTVSANLWRGAMVVAKMTSNGWNNGMKHQHTQLPRRPTRWLLTIEMSERKDSVSLR